jgi:hypothetical protein
MPGIHAAQRWFNGSWFMPPEEGYSRVVPIRWLPAFTGKSNPVAHTPQKEWEAAVLFLTWIREQLTHHDRTDQQVLMVADGGYDTLNLWKNLPDEVMLLARSAKNRMPPANAHDNRKYGERVATPQPLLVNAVQNDQGEWVLPLPLDTLLYANTARRG